MNTKILEKFGKQLKSTRLEKNLSQEELAEKLNIHRTYMSFLERGQSSPSLLLIFRISRALGLTLHELFRFDS